MRGPFVMPRGGPMSTLTTEHIEAPTVSEVDEALWWATRGGVRVMAFVDALLDARLEAQQ